MGNLHKPYTRYNLIKHLLASVFFISALFCGTAWASDAQMINLHMTDSTAGLIAVALFVLAYCLVIGEEFLHLRKSKPVLLAAGFIWMIVGIVRNLIGQEHAAEIMVRHYFLEASELMIFLFVAMTYVVALEERRVFEVLRV